jgi:hypothetical protein
VKLLLTGQLPFILLLATLLALPTSFGLLHRYRRAVVRSMRASGNSSGIAAEPSRQTPPPEDRSGARPTAASLETALVRGPWHTAGIYAIAGLAYAAVIVTGVLLSAGFEFFPMRVLFVIVSFAWPIVLTVNLVAGTVPRARRWAPARYFAVLGVITIVAVVRSPPTVTPVTASTISFVSTMPGGRW